MSTRAEILDEDEESLENIDCKKLRLDEIYFRGYLFGAVAPGRPLTPDLCPMASCTLHRRQGTPTISENQENCCGKNEASGRQPEPKLLMDE